MNIYNLFKEEEIKMQLDLSLVGKIETFTGSKDMNGNDLYIGDRVIVFYDRRDGGTGYYDSRIIEFTSFLTRKTMLRYWLKEKIPGSEHIVSLMFSNYKCKKISI